MVDAIEVLRSIEPRIRGAWRLFDEARPPPHELVSTPEEAFEVLAASIPARNQVPRPTAPWPEPSVGPWTARGEGAEEFLVLRLRYGIAGIDQLSRARVREVLSEHVPAPSDALVEHATHVFVALQLEGLSGECYDWFADNLRNQPEHPVSKQILELASTSWPELSTGPAVTLVGAAAQTSTIAARPLLERVLAARTSEPSLQRELDWELRCIAGYYENPPPPGTSLIIF